MKEVLFTCLTNTERKEAYEAVKLFSFLFMMEYMNVGGKLKYFFS